MEPEGGPRGTGSKVRPSLCKQQWGEGCLRLCRGEHPIQASGKIPEVADQREQAAGMVLLGVKARRPKSREQGGGQRTCQDWGGPREREEGMACREGGSRGRWGTLIQSRDVQQHPQAPSGGAGHGGMELQGLVYSFSEPQSAAESSIGQGPRWEPREGLQGRALRPPGQQSLTLSPHAPSC